MQSHEKYMNEVTENNVTIRRLLYQHKSNNNQLLLHAIKSALPKVFSEIGPVISLPKFRELPVCFAIDRAGIKINDA